MIFWLVLGLSPQPEPEPALPAPSRLEGAAAARPPTLPLPPECPAILSPPDTPLFVLAHRKAETLSDIWLRSEEKDTDVADVEVRPGPPIHLVISSRQRTVYRFTGSPERVRQLTVMNGFGAGVVGISSRRVEFTGLCIGSSVLLSPDRARADEAIQLVFGRRPIAVLSTHGLWRARVDHGITALRAPPPDLRRSSVETRALFSFSPGGISSVDLSRLVTTVAAGKHRTLPRQAGVRQLVESGALIRATEADARRWEAAARLRGARNPQGWLGTSYGIYRVTRPIRLPVALCGAHSIRLYVRVRAWVRGDPCHSTIYVDDGTEEDAFARPN